VTVAAFHPDGYVREAAVACLSERAETLSFPTLALRAADWVPQVRDRARLALEQRLTDPSGGALVNIAAVALALRERHEGRWLTERIEAALREGPVGLLPAALTAPDWRTRRLAYTTALAAGRLDVAQLLRAAQHDGDLPIRVQCAVAAVKAAVAAGTIDIVRPLLSSGTAMVRAEAVQAMAGAGDVTPAVEALSDRNPMVRAVAQAALRRAGSDPATYYRRLVATVPPEPGAIAGLGETGTPDDASLIRPWLDHLMPRGRAETIRALRRLGAADPDTVSGMLTDPSGRVTRQVTTALRPWVDRLDVQWLRHLLAETNPQHVRMAAYRLLHDHDVWTRLLVDLELICDSSPSLRNRARSDLMAWLTREAPTTYSMPQGQVADALAQELGRAEAVLGQHQIRLMRFHLGIKAPPTA
jgi:HEAT repeat protein